MVTLAEVFRLCGAAYLVKHAASIPQRHRRAMEAIVRCRTPEAGVAHYQCPSCGRSEVVPLSCGNRHCPACQGHKARRWHARRQAERLPTPYFLITFTVPASLRQFVRSHQRVCYSALFRAAIETLRKLAADPKYVGSGRIGCFAVLHTWGRAMNYHVHLHVVVPAGALSEDGQKWLPSRADFFVPVWAASKIYRAKFRDELARAGMLGQVDPRVWHEAWTVDSRAVGDGKHVLDYLAPYVYRVAISNRRIVCCEDGEVKFLYRPSGTRGWKPMRLAAQEFIRRFLTHVLPGGLTKVRHYGFLHPSSRYSIDHVRERIAECYEGFVADLPAESERGPQAWSASSCEEPAGGVICPECGAVMRLVRVSRRPREKVAPDTG